MEKIEGLQMITNSSTSSGPYKAVWECIICIFVFGKDRQYSRRFLLTHHSFQLASAWKQLQNEVVAKDLELEE